MTEDSSSRQLSDIVSEIADATGVDNADVEKLLSHIGLESASPKLIRGGSLRLAIGQVSL